MGIFNKLFSSPDKSAQPNQDPNQICAPMNGQIIDLSEIPDPVFSTGAMGKGCGIIPEEDMLYSPVNGTVAMTFPTGHAIGLQNDENVEILLHVGMDTVNMNGKGFKVKVKPGQKVKVGDPLVAFSRKAIEEAGFTSITAMVITDAEGHCNVDLLKTGPVQKGEPVLKVTRS